MYETYRREYENFTHLPGESIDALFQQFTVVVNNMRDNVDVLLYNDHDRAVKLLHSLDHTVWGGEFEAIVEFDKYDTLTVNELFSKLKWAEVDRGMTTKIEGSTDSHSLALIGGSKGNSNANPSTRMFFLSSLMSLPDEEFDVLGEDELAILTRQFERMHENRVNSRSNSRACFKCGKARHFFHRVSEGEQPRQAQVQGQEEEVQEEGSWTWEEDADLREDEEIKRHQVRLRGHVFKLE
jgi:hypothetical protein